MHELKLQLQQRRTSQLTNPTLDNCK